MLRILTTLVLMLSPIAVCNAQNADYHEGQVWEYQTRPGEAQSLLKIQLVESDNSAGDDAPIYHISIIGVNVGISDLWDDLPHLPVSETTLDMSVVRLSNSQAAFPDPSEGILVWREAHGGVFTVSVSEIVEIVEQTLATGNRSDR